MTHAAVANEQAEIAHHADSKDRHRVRFHGLRNAHGEQNGEDEEEQEGQKRFHRGWKYLSPTREARDPKAFKPEIDAPTKGERIRRDPITLRAELPLAATQSSTLRPPGAPRDAGRGRGRFR